MYIGRIVCVGRTSDGRVYAAYRVSSRSFPNRTAVLIDGRAAIVPKPGHEGDIHKNPYIAYNCVRVVADGRIAVATNGSHTDPIAEKIDLGMPIREALTLSHLAMDYEKDQYNTPRVSGVINRDSGETWLAVVRDDGITVRRYDLEPGQYSYVATYEENDPMPPATAPDGIDSAERAAKFVLGAGIFAERPNAVSAVSALATASGFDLYACDAPQAG
jgi:IMP cyclohydrolase